MRDMAKETHFVMFPWLAYGHMLPFLELSKCLAEKGVIISFISTPKNIRGLPPIPPNLSARINLVKFPLPTVEGLPENTESTTDMPKEAGQYLRMAYNALQAPFETFIGERLPDLIIYDFVACWVPAIASKYGVPSAFFSVFSAATLAFQGPPRELGPGRKRTTLEDFMVVPDWITFPSTVAFQRHEAIPFFHNLDRTDEYNITGGQRFAKAIEGCDVVLVRSCREFEGDYLSLIQQLYQKQVLPVGFLPPAQMHLGIATQRHEAQWSSIFQWLDTKTPKSVVFVGFGSEFKITRDQVHELAFGLELSKLPFVWALRKPSMGMIDDSDLLPQGFEARISDRGIVSVGWTPQLEILAHPAIGGCLFHSGWGSIIESLHYGHALVGMPMIYDQGLNARLLVDKEVCFEVGRNEDGSFTRDAVAMSLRYVMAETEGAPLRQKAGQMTTVFANQDLQESYINGLLQYLDEYGKKKSTNF